MTESVSRIEMNVIIQFILLYGLGEFPFLFMANVKHDPLGD